jgi:hypothetical protein
LLSFENGNVTGTSDLDNPANGIGAPSSSAINEIYSVSANGRGTLGQQGAILYIISDSQFIAMTAGNNPYLVDFNQ